MSEPEYPELKYPWQKLVFDVFVELRPERLADKVSVAERALLARLRDPVPPDKDERIALNDALRALRVLFPHAAKNKQETSDGEA